MSLFQLAFFTLFILVGANNTPASSDVETVVAQRSMSLENRYPVASVNEVFKDNILLNLAYMDGRVAKREDIKWEEIRKPFRAQFVLNPNEAFAFQEDVLAPYQGRVVKTTNAHFNLQEGFRTDGYLAGDGVCHLASLIYWAAKDAGLDAYAPANHDFAPIPDVPKEYGVSIYSMPGSPAANAGQNLYITNSLTTPVTFTFLFDGKTLSVSVTVPKGATQQI